MRMFPSIPQNWTIITDGMYDVTQPGLYHTAGAEDLPGIDFAGKTGTAQQMSHEALGKTNKGTITYPNVWFVGVTPRRNPELVVAVLWQNGEFSYYPARIGAQVVEAFVDKKRRLANNLPPEKAAAPVEVGAVWTTPDAHPARRTRRLQRPKARFTADIFSSRTGRLWLRTKAMRKPAFASEKCCASADGEGTYKTDRSGRGAARTQAASKSLLKKPESGARSVKCCSGAKPSYILRPLRHD